MQDRTFESLEEAAMELHRATFVPAPGDSSFRSGLDGDLDPGPALRFRSLASDPGDQS